MFTRRHAIECPPRARTAACLAVIACFAAAPAAAQSWLGGGGNSNWSNAANWNPTGVPANGSALTFFANVGLLSSNNDALTSVSSITFLSAAGANTLGGNGLGLTGGVLNSATFLQTINLPLTLAGPASFFLANDGDLQFGAVNLGAFQLNSIGSKTTTIAGPVTGSGAVRVAGGGTLVLSNGANTFSGGSTVENGTLSISSGSALGTGSLTLGLTATQGTLRATADVTTANGIVLSPGTGGGRLEALSGTTLTANGVISGTGPLSILGPGTVALGGVNTFTGVTTVTSGTLRMLNNASTNSSAVTVNSGATLATDANATIGSLAGAGGVTLGAGTLTAGVNNASSTYSGVLSGAGSFAKSGGGTLTLSGSNTHSGGTTINGGTLVLTGSNAYSGGTTLNGGTLLISSDANLGAAAGGLSFNGGTLRVTGTGGASMNRAMTMAAGGGTLAVDAGAYLSNFGALSGTGALTKTGDGQFDLAGSYAAYSGATTIAAGTLGVFGDALHGSTVTVNAGTTLTGPIGASIGALTGGGSVIIGYNDGDGYLSAGSNGASTMFFGTISGGGKFIKDGVGTLTLFGNQTYTGATTVAAGTLNVLGILTGTSSIDVLSGATLSGNGYIGTFVTGEAGSTIATQPGGVLALSTVNSVGNLSVVGGNAVMVLQNNVAVSGVASVDGGVLIANSLNLGTTGSITGHGTVLATILGGTGATINATGPSLTLGNASVSGAMSSYGGALNVGASNVVLLEGARFPGAATLLSGNVTIAGGVLSAPLGIELKNSSSPGGATLSGYGTVNDAFINRGLVTGGAGASVLTFSGAVSGPGSFLGNVQFAGSYSPGNSPAAVTLGHAEFGALDKLTMELGGTTLGTGYDHLTFLDQGILGGTLNVTLIDGFTLAGGYSFDLFDGPLFGKFDTVNLPTLATGLSWNTSSLYTTGTLGVTAVPEPETYGMLLAGLGMMGYVARRRRAKVRKSRS